MAKKIKDKKDPKTEKEFLKHRRKVAKLYKEGYALGELCRFFRLDVSSVLFLLRKSKIKKKNLYIIFKNQIDNAGNNKEIITQKERQLIEKLFPLNDISSLSGGYYWHWKERYKQTQKKKESCKHTIRNIQCARCNKILRDASNIPVDNAITIETNRLIKVNI